jgi:hypothetical protein
MAGANPADPSLLRALSRRVAAQVTGRRESAEPTPTWAVPPVRTPALPEVRAIVLASERLTTGLAAEWTQVGAPGGQAPAGADLVLVEIMAGSSPSASVIAHAEGDDPVPPVVVWATSGGPSPEVETLAKEAAAVFVADPDHLEAWQKVAPAARLLAPAASGRVRPANDRAGVTVIVDGPVAPAVAGQVATVLARAVRPLEEELFVRRVDSAASLPKLLSWRATGDGTYAEAASGIAEAAVVVDGPRRAPNATWTVLDAAAARTPVISLAGLPQPDGVTIPTPGDDTSLRSEIVARLRQPELRDREALRLLRAVRCDHTYAHRVDEILGAIGRPPARAGRSVSAVVPTNRLHEIDNLLANVGRQAHRELELVLVLHGVGIDHGELRARAEAAGVPSLTVIEADETETLGACMNLGVDAAGGDYVAKMDDDNHYGVHYLTDLLDAFDTSGAGIVGKWAHYVWLRSTGAVVLRYPDAEHAYQRRIQGGSMLFTRDVVRTLRFSDIPRAVDSDILDRAIADGIKIWSADRFNYVSTRGAPPPVDPPEARVARPAWTNHTWRVADATFLTASGRLEFYGDPRPHVEV